MGAVSTLTGMIQHAPWKSTRTPDTPGLNLWPRNGDTRVTHGEKWTFAGNRWWREHTNGYTEPRAKTAPGPPPALQRSAQRAAKARAGRAGR